MDLLQGILSRRSIRKFTGEEVSRDLLLEIIRAGTWAPSGLNNQPWRFAVVRSGEVREAMAALTRYGHIIRGAPALIAVFCHRESMYHETKDHQAMGACLQNMLLAAHGLGLGAVWLGEILKSAEAVRMLLEIPEGHDLMAVLAVGYPDPGSRPSSNRKPLEALLLKEI